MYEIARASEHLRYEGLGYTGCPLLIRSGRIDPVGSRFLMHVWVGKSPDTTLSYANALKGWLIWLSFRRLDWWRADVDDVLRYRHALTGSRAGSSINVTLCALASFQKWAYEKGFTPVKPFKLAFTTSGKVIDGYPQLRPIRTLKRVPRTHTNEEFDAILAATPRADAGICLRDELVAELGNRCGLRRLEVAGLTTKDILDATKEDVDFFTLMLRTTKGGKQRLIIVPATLMSRLRRYINVYRKCVVRNQLKKSPRYAEPSALFLTIHGTVLKREYITASWAASSKRAGITSRFHLNRHSFATRVIEATDRAKLPSRRIAQQLLGHASELSTAIYDHSTVVKRDEEWVTQVLKDAYDE